MNSVPGVVIEADDDAPFGESLLVVVTKCKECESFLVLSIVLVDVDYS
jgi:hypothetical protein